MRREREYRFNILNLAKSDSLYNDGMQVLIFSEKREQQEWFRGGYDITYKSNTYKREVGPVGASRPSTSKVYYTFSFSYCFEQEDDTVYFAYCHPYGYSDLQRDLERYEGSVLFQRAELCRTLAGYRVDVLTITNPERG